jgi:hypothetical protein
MTAPTEVNMLKRQALATVLVAGLGIALAGCSGVQEQLGLTSTPPDEFAVYSRAPLSVPPDFALLPPQPGAPRPQEATPTQQAQTALFSNSGTYTFSNDLQPTGPTQSMGEQAFLQSAGATGIDPEIRTLVEAETDIEAAQTEQFVNGLVFWQEPIPAGVVIDPAAEQQRIQENAALGVPITTGETPVIERKQKGVLEDLF